MLQVLGTILVIALVGAAVWLHWHYQRVRREALQAFARSIGFKYSPHKDKDFHRRYDHGIFDRGNSRRAWNVLQGGFVSGGMELAIAMGDYAFTEGSGKDRRTRELGFLLAELPFPEVPDLVIRRENLFDRVAGAFGFDDIDFESEEFSRTFHVSSPDKRFAYAVIHQRMMEFLLQISPPSVELRRGVLLVWEGVSGTWDLDDFRKHLNWTKRFFGLWPEHLVAEFKERRRA